MSRHMSRQPISFRLSEHEFEILESNQRPDESLNQTAARLLREKLGVINGSINNLEVKTLDRIIESKVDRLREDVNAYVDNRVNSLIERITAIESKPRSPRRTSAKNTVESEKV